MVFGHDKNNCYVHLNVDGAIGETDILIKVCIYVNKYITNKFCKFLIMYALLLVMATAYCHLLGVSIFKDLTVLLYSTSILYVKTVLKLL